MTTPDLINGFFELGGGVLLAMNCRRLYRDKRTMGVSIVPTAFFMCWGWWNLWFYPSLNAWASFVGGIGVVASNTVWVGMMVYYSRRNQQ